MGDDLLELIEIEEKLRGALFRARNRLRATSGREVDVEDILNYAGRIRFTTSKTRKFQRDSFVKEPFPSVFEFRRAVAHETSSANRDEEEKTNGLSINKPEPRPLTRRHSSNDSMVEADNDPLTPRKTKRARRGGRLSLNIAGDDDDDDDDVW
jgi:hypothetical protein